jgi:hypothetical protein
MTLVALAACSRKQQPQPELPLRALRVVLSSEIEIAKLGGGDVARRPWVGPIVQMLAEEKPDALAPFAQSRIPGSGMTADALFERGLANLRQACTQPIQDRTVAMAKANVQITRAADDYSTARLLLPELWSKIAADAGGHLTAAAPARDILIWTTSTAPDDQSTLRRQAQIAFESRSYPIAPAILRWTGAGWALEDANPLP